MDNAGEMVTAAQGSQPTLGTLRVGIIDVACFNNVSKARLLLRPQSGDKSVTMTEGNSLDIPGHGVLTLHRVHLEGNGAVTLTLQSEPTEA